MFRMNKALRLSPCILIMIAFIGCAASGSNNLPTEVYHPKLPAGIGTFEAAKKDLAGLLEGRKSTFRIFVKEGYFAQYGMNDYGGLLNGGAKGSYYQFYTNPLSTIIDTNTIFVRDYMLKISSHLFVLYADLTDLPITVDRAAIILGDQISFNLANVRGYPSALNTNVLNDAQRIADDLFFIQQNFQKDHGKQLALFEAQGAQYRALKIKPQISEEQRRLIVQANALSQRKDYAEAIDRYLKAIDLDPVSYPEAYFNLALLSAQVHRFKASISYMKKYLLLVPDAKDARSAQDKIYEWEFMIKK